MSRAPVQGKAKDPLVMGIVGRSYNSSKSCTGTVAEDPSPTAKPTKPTKPVLPTKNSGTVASNSTQSAPEPKPKKDEFAEAIALLPARCRNQSETAALDDQDVAEWTARAHTFWDKLYWDVSIHPSGRTFLSVIRDNVAGRDEDDVDRGPSGSGVGRAASMGQDAGGEQGAAPAQDWLEGVHEDLWLCCLSYLSTHEATRCALVCRQLHEQVLGLASEELWQRLAYRMYGDRLREAPKAGPVVAASFREACLWSESVGLSAVVGWCQRVKDSAQSLLEECLPQLDQAHHLLQNLNMQDLHECRTFQRLPPLAVIASRLHRILMCYGHADKSGMADTKYFQKNLGTNPRWINDMQHYDKDNIHPSKASKLQDALCQANLNFDKVIGTSCGLWCHNCE